MQMAVEEVLSMKALLVQALASGVTGGQQRSEPCAPLPKMDTDEHETDEPEPPVDEQRDRSGRKEPSDLTCGHMTADQPRSPTKPGNRAALSSRWQNEIEAQPSWN